MSKVIATPWAILCPRETGVLYGLGSTRAEAWANAILVMHGTNAHGGMELERQRLKARGYVARQVEVRLP